MLRTTRTAEWATGRLPIGASARRWLLALAVALGLFQAGCATQLVPEYDPSIVAGLNKANQEAMTLFASVQNGVSASTFSRREATYNDLIGQLDALRIATGARPQPVPRIGGARADPPEDVADIERFEWPTPEVLTELVRTISSMRNTDSAGGLSATLVATFKNAFEISMDQALTLERALQR